MKEKYTKSFMTTKKRIRNILVKNKPQVKNTIEKQPKSKNYKITNNSMKLDYSSLILNFLLAAKYADICCVY